MTLLCHYKRISLLKKSSSFKGVVFLLFRLHRFQKFWSSLDGILGMPVYRKFLNHLSNFVSPSNSLGTKGNCICYIEKSNKKKLDKDGQTIRSFLRAVSIFYSNI